MSQREKPTFENLIKRIQQNKHLKYKYPLSYYKVLEQQFKHRQVQDKSVDMRRRILKNQRISNYQNEYDKIKGILDHTIVPTGHSLQYYKDRIKYLEKNGRECI
jgi:hypothetical protein